MRRASSTGKPGLWVKVQNQGLGYARGTAHFRIRNRNDPDYTRPDARADVTLSPGASRWLLLQNVYLSLEAPTLDLDITVNSDRKIEESSYDNNTFAVSSASCLRWQIAAGLSGPGGLILRRAARSFALS